MDYILLVLLIILFLNKQNKDRLIKINHKEESYDENKLNNIIGNIKRRNMALIIVIIQCKQGVITIRDIMNQIII